MHDLPSLAVDVAAIGVGLFFIGYTLWRVAVHRKQAGALSPRAARIWRWRIVLGLCWGSMGLFFGSCKLLPQVGVDGFRWLIVPGLFAAIGWLVALVMIAELGGNGGARWRAPDDDTM